MQMPILTPREGVDQCPSEARARASVVDVRALRVGILDAGQFAQWRRSWRAEVKARIIAAGYRSTEAVSGVAQCCEPAPDAIRPKFADAVNELCESTCHHA